uniref:Uncharacterized protein n=1 Tax=Romanomermis culicivorax TaxID=13658 RepID=A0A915JAK5_ROMCU
MKNRNVAKSDNSYYILTNRSVKPKFNESDPCGTSLLISDNQRELCYNSTALSKAFFAAGETAKNWTERLFKEKYNRLGVDLYYQSPLSFWVARSKLYLLFFEINIQLLPFLRKAGGFVHEALNASLKINALGYTEPAVEILSMVQRPITSTGEPVDFGRALLQQALELNFVTFHVSDLALFIDSEEKIFKLCMWMDEKNINNHALESCYTSAAEMRDKNVATYLMEKMVDKYKSNNRAALRLAPEEWAELSKTPVGLRQQCFFPLIQMNARQNDLNGLKGVFDMMLACNCSIEVQVLAEWMWPCFPGTKEAGFVVVIRAAFYALFYWKECIQNPQKCECSFNGKKYREVGRRYQFHWQNCPDGKQCHCPELLNDICLKAGNTDYGKTLTNKEGHIDVHYCYTKKAIEASYSPYLKRTKLIKENCYEVEQMKKTFEDDKLLIDEAVNLTDKWISNDSYLLDTINPYVAPVAHHNMHVGLRKLTVFNLHSLDQCIDHFRMNSPIFENENHIVNFRFLKLSRVGENEKSHPWQLSRQYLEVTLKYYKKISSTIGFGLHFVLFQLKDSK